MTVTVWFWFCSVEGSFEAKGRTYTESREKLKLTKAPWIGGGQQPSQKRAKWGKIELFPQTKDNIRIHVFYKKTGHVLRCSDSGWEARTARKSLVAAKIISPGVANQLARLHGCLWGSGLQVGNEGLVMLKWLKPYKTLVYVFRCVSKIRNDSSFSVSTLCKSVSWHELVFSSALRWKVEGGGLKWSMDGY